MYLHRTCAFCGRIGPVGTDKNELEGDHVVYWTTDPFAEEIHQDFSRDWQCGSCIYDSCMEI